MRTALYQRLVQSPFVTRVPAERIYMASRQGVDASPLPAVEDGPWAALSVQDTQPGVLHVVECRVTLDVYDRPGSYLAVDAALQVARSAMALVPFVDVSSGEILQETRWEGYSDDRFEEDYRAIYRQATWQLIGTQRVSG